PEDDQRRKPSYRFDQADVRWLQAAVSFARAGLNIAGAYDWGSAARLVLGRPGREGVHVKLRDAQKMHAAGDLIAQGLQHSLQCRDLALAETDDDREWMPNPLQKNHPMPLQVDEQLYE